MFDALIICNYHQFSQEVFKKKRHHKTPKPTRRGANRGANLGPWLHHIMSIIQMEQQPLAGSQSGGLRKVARQCGQGRRFSPAGAGGGLKSWDVRFFVSMVFGNVWHGFLYHIHQKRSKTICIWYTVCTNISKLICFGVGILRARQNAHLKTPKMNPNSEGPSRTGSPQTTAPWNQGPKKAGPETGPVRQLHPVEGSNFSKRSEDSRVRWILALGSL